MPMRTSFCRLMLVTLALGFVGATATVRAEDLGAVKARMGQRLSQLDQLKSEGAVGENNRGLLEVRGGGATAADVVAAENRDRAEVYAEIAKRTNVSAEQVGRQRARQIAAGSAKGVWLQGEDGAWYRK